MRQQKHWGCISFVMACRCCDDVMGLSLATVQTRIGLHNGHCGRFLAKDAKKLMEKQKRQASNLTLHHQKTLGVHFFSLRSFNTMCVNMAVCLGCHYALIELSESTTLIFGIVCIPRNMGIMVCSAIVSEAQLQVMQLVPHIA